jgi:hypothetical protein
MSEHSEQCALFHQAALQQNVYPELKLLHAVPNGTRTTPGVAGKMKAEGVKKGVPDICLPVARGRYIGLYIEMKAIYNSGKRGQTSPEQREWLNALAEQGHYTAVCYSAEEAWTVITAYLEGRLA